MNISTIHASTKPHYSKSAYPVSDWVRTVGSTLENRLDTEQIQQIKDKIDIAFRAQLSIPITESSQSQVAPQTSEPNGRGSTRRRSSSTQTVPVLTPEVYTSRKSEFLQNDATRVTPVSVESQQTAIQALQQELSRSRAQPNPLRSGRDQSTNDSIRQRPTALLDTLQAQKQAHHQAISSRTPHRRRLSQFYMGQRTDAAPQIRQSSATQTEDSISRVAEALKNKWVDQAEVKRLADRKQQSEETRKMLLNRATHLRAELQSLKKKNDEFKTQIQKYEAHINVIETNKKKLSDSLRKFTEHSEQLHSQALEETKDNITSIDRTIKTSTDNIKALAKKIEQKIDAESIKREQAKSDMEKTVTQANSKAETEIDKLSVDGKRFKIKIECDGQVEYLYSPIWDELRVNKHDDKSYKFAMTYWRSCRQSTWTLILKSNNTYQIKSESDEYFLKFSEKPILNKNSYRLAVTSKDEARTWWEINQISDTQFTIMKDGKYLNVVGGHRSRPEVEWESAYFAPSTEIEVWQGADKIVYHNDKHRRPVTISDLYNYWIIEPE